MSMFGCSLGSWRARENNLSYGLQRKTLWSGYSCCVRMTILCFSLWFLTPNTL